MSNRNNMIPIPGRLHSVAVGEPVSGADEIFDDSLNKDQATINQQVNEAIGTGGSVDSRIAAAVNVEKERAQTAESTLSGNITTEQTRAEAVEGALGTRVDTLEEAVGTGGSVDERIETAKSEVIGDAASDYNTLGKLEDKIQAEASARQDAITAETNRATTRENQIYDLVHTPEQHYVTVPAYADLANIASPSDDTVYRVSSYNGKTSQVDSTVYSEYGYDGTNFVFLCVKSQIDEVYDISAHHSNNTYVDLAAALDGGNNIPQELRRGGMSVKYVQSSDNKYVQYILLKNIWSATINDWQKVVLEEDVYGETIYNKNKTIASGEYRSVNYDFPQIENDEYGCLLVTGLSEGQIALANSSWEAKAIVPFTNGITSYFIIPKDCPNIVIGTKNDTPVSEDTPLYITILKGGVVSELKKYTERLDNDIENASLINVSSEFPTGGTNGTNIYTSTNARNAVPVSRRKVGTTLIYLTESGLRIERFDYATYSDSSWLYGTWTVLTQNPVLNIDSLSGLSSFDNRVDTFAYIPNIYRVHGLIITYTLKGRTIVEQFIGATWASANSSWSRIADITDISNLDYYDSSIQENLFYEYLQSKYFEIGSIYNGVDRDNSKHCRCIYFPCKKGDSIVCKNRNFEFVLFTYDSTKTYITSSAWNDFKCDITTDGYFRLVFRNTADTDFNLNDITPTDIVLIRQIDNNYQYESLKLHTRQRVLWSQKGDFVLGYLSNGVLVAHNKRMSTLRYYPVKKGDKVFVNNNLYSFYVTEYNQSKQFISASPYYSREYIQPGSHPFGWYVVKNDGFVRLTFSIINDDDWDSTIVDTADRFFGIIPQKISFEERMAWDGINHSKIIVEKKPLFVPTQETIYQDGTFINGNLWLFPENDGTINIINPETGVVVDTKTHTLGHCSSVDYNKNNDCLICKQEGSGHATSQKIQIYKNPSAANSLAPTDANCTLVNLFNDDFHFNDEGTGSIMWGEANDIVYFCNGREASETGNENQWSNKHYIYKLRLGMGSNDLSSETDGMGVFVSDKADDEYNGTCCIIKTYTGYIMEGCDTYVGASSSSYFQGAEYDGYIYIGWGTSGHNFLKIELDDDYGSFKVVENYMHKFYDASHNEIFYEPELVAINNGRIYCGSRKYAQGSVLLSFNL